MMATGSSFGTHGSLAVLPPQVWCLLAKLGGLELAAKANLGGSRMPQGRKARRQELKARLERAEMTLSATRNSASGRSRAVLLHLEREIQASKKELALLDAQAADSGSANAS
jgi:hypothetical protein